MAERAPLRLCFDEYELDEPQARLSRGGTPVALAPKAFGVLCALLQRRGELVTKDSLLDAVWGHRHVTESVLKTTISELRAALLDDAKAPRFVETAARRGYRFIAATRPASVAPPFVAQPSAQAAQPAIVGRTEELAALLALWSSAEQGVRQLCWVAGEAGIGKTTLIDAVIAAAGAARVARGQCIEQFGAGEPYLPVLDALGSLCRQDPSLAPLLRAVAPTWLLQMPWLMTPAEHLSLRSQLAAVSQDRMLREFAELLEQYTAGVALLLVTEDLHWCDDATVRLLDHMARRRSSARLLWLGSFRGAELVSQGHPLNGLRHELRARRLCEEIALEPFSEAELAAYLGHRLPALAADEEAVRRLHRHTDGLPLFVSNVVEDLRSDVPPPEWPVPASLAGAVERHVSRLSADALRMLEAAAVCGHEFRVGLLAEVLRAGRDKVEQECDALVRGQHWLRALPPAALGEDALDAGYAFVHAIYRQVLYGRMTAADQVRWHRAVAAALQRRQTASSPVSPAELADHLERGLLPAAALAAYAAAAQSALGRFAPTETLQLIERALPLIGQCPDDDGRAELELQLMHLRGAALAQSVGVSSPQADAAFRRAAELCDRLPPSASRAWALTGLSWTFTSRGQYADARALAGRLRALAQEQEDGVLLAAALCAIAVPQVQQGRLLESEPLVEEAVSLSANIEARRLYTALVIDPVVAALGIGAALKVQLGKIDEALAWAELAMARADAIGQPITRGFSMRCAGMVRVRLGDARTALHLARGMQEVVQAHGLVQGWGPSLCLLAWAECALGDRASGRRHFDEGIAELEDRVSLFDVSHIQGAAAEAALDDGDREAARRELHKAWQRAAQLGESLHEPQLLLCEGRLALEEGDMAKAREAWRDSARRAHAMSAALAELAALTALCSLPGAGRPEREALVRLRSRWPADAAWPLLQQADRAIASA